MLGLTHGRLTILVGFFEMDDLKSLEELANLLARVRRQFTRPIILRPHKLAAKEPAGLKRINDAPPEAVEI